MLTRDPIPAKQVGAKRENWVGKQYCLRSSTEQTATFLQTKGRVAKPQKLSFSVLRAVFSPADDKLELTEQLEARTVCQEKNCRKKCFVRVLALGRQLCDFCSLILIVL